MFFLPITIISSKIRAARNSVISVIGGLLAWDHLETHLHVIVNQKKK